MSTPRGLNEPVFWNSSAFRNTRAPASSPSVAEPNTGDFLIKLKRKRDKSSDEVIEELRHKIAESEPVIAVEFPHILEDLIVAAHADARRKAEAVMQEKMKNLTGGLPLPPGLKLF